MRERKYMIEGKESLSEYRNRPSAIDPDLAELVFVRHAGEPLTADELFQLSVLDRSCEYWGDFHENLVNGAYLLQPPESRN